MPYNAKILETVPSARTPALAEALTAVWERSVRATHSFISEADIAAYRPLVQKGFMAPELRLFVVWIADTPIGFMQLLDTHIDTLFLEPEAIGHGFGARLVTLALSLGAQTVDVNEENAHARKFYESFNFRLRSRSPVDPLGKPYPILRLGFLKK